MVAPSLVTLIPWTWVVLGLAVAFVARKLTSTRWRSARLPPGPIPLPLIGNVLDMPRKSLAREFAALSERYGDVVHLNVLGQSNILLGSYQAACDLFDKRSANYSDRPPSFMVKLCGLEWLFVLMNYGQEWRQHRRAFHQQMSPDVITQYEPIQLKTSRQLLQHLLKSPQDLDEHLKFAFASTVMRIVYGIDLNEPHGQYFDIVERMGEVAEEIGVPGRFPVESLPFLRFFPAWLPGGRYKRWAQEARRDILHGRDYLFDSAKAAMTRGTAQESFVTRLMSSLPADPKAAAAAEEVYKGVTASAYAAGADTTNAAMQAFFLAMALYPEVQKKAQEELDAVVGSGRLPDFSDRPSLPYISAIVKELLRWHIVTPMAVPHRVVADDEYKGYHIPKGAILIANVWSMSRDPAVYPDPEIFDPERFIKDGRLHLGNRDPAGFMFGFGRRICPGKNFAESSLFILCSSVLSAFTIGAPVDSTGQPIVLEHEETTLSLISHPRVYNYTIKPRSNRAEQLIQAA